MKIVGSRKPSRSTTGAMVSQNFMARAAKGKAAQRTRNRKITEVPMPEALAKFFRPIGGA